MWCTRMDKIRNEIIRETTKAVEILKKTQEDCSGAEKGRDMWGEE